MKDSDPKEIAREFGEFIKNARSNKSLTQAEVAKALGISQSYYHFLENGDRNIDLSLALNLCRYLDIDLNEFVQSTR